MGNLYEKALEEELETIRKELRKEREINRSLQEEIEFLEKEIVNQTRIITALNIKIRRYEQLNESVQIFSNLLKMVIDEK